jgi:hypothetical protein
MSSDSEEFYDIDEQDVTVVAGDKYNFFLLFSAASVQI